MAESKVLFTPEGVVSLDDVKKPERFEIKPGVGAWLEQFDDVASFLKLGIYCSLCKSDMVAKNHEGAAVYSVVCACRELVWPNRSRRPATLPTVN